MDSPLPAASAAENGTPGRAGSGVSLPATPVVHSPKSREGWEGLRAQQARVAEIADGEGAAEVSRRQVVKKQKKKRSKVSSAALFERLQTPTEAHVQRVAALDNKTMRFSRALRADFDRQRIQARRQLARQVRGIRQGEAAPEEVEEVQQRLGKAWHYTKEKERSFAPAPLLSARVDRTKARRVVDLEGVVERLYRQAQVRDERLQKAQHDKEEEEWAEFQRLQEEGRNFMSEKTRRMVEDGHIQSSIPPASPGLHRPKSAGHSRRTTPRPDSGGLPHGRPVREVPHSWESDAAGGPMMRTPAFKQGAFTPQGSPPVRHYASPAEQTHGEDGSPLFGAAAASGQEREGTPTLLGGK